MDFKAKWITPPQEMGDVCPVFQKVWAMSDSVKKAELLVTALGVYEAKLNGKRVGEYVLAPGWTAYEKRLQYQIYDITELIKEQNTLEITVGKGWYRSPMPGWVENEGKKKRIGTPCGLFGEIRLTFDNDDIVILPTDTSWKCAESPVRFSEIYDGESFDARFCPQNWEGVREFEGPTDTLIPQEGEEIREMEYVCAKRIFVTPAGETVIDFGQEITGYVEISVEAREGDRIRILHGEVLDAEGNFYNENYRSAKAQICYICKEGKQTWHPVHTFFGFRYLKLEEFPGEAHTDQFMGIAVYSNMKKTGAIRCGVPELNQLMSNIFWGQKGNFLDVPTDCPQRDERLGWTGDAEVFVKTASYNFDVEKFFSKWLHDLAADQWENGAVPHVIPDYLGEAASAAWGDAAAICPWQIYQTYGNKKILREQFGSMKKWVNYITEATSTPYLWTGGTHFGDWLGLDAPSGSYKGSSRDDLIASAFYAWSAGLVVKAGKVLGEEVDEYENLQGEIISAFRKKFTEYRTQTEYAVAVRFGLAENPQKSADELAELVKKDGVRLKTGFVGTPMLLHVLSAYGHSDLAYSLLLRREYPSWIYPITKGATTIWEHWDGIMPDGGMWSTDMNSFNHYAYGAVADWIYEEAAGITPELPGFEKARIEPKPDGRLGWLEASLETRHGKITSGWSYESIAEAGGMGIRYEIEAEMPAVIVINEKEYQVKPGKYIFWT